MSEPHSPPYPRVPPRAAPEDFPRNTGAGGHVAPDGPAPSEMSPDPEANIIPSDAPGG